MLLKATCVALAISVNEKICGSHFAGGKYQSAAHDAYEYVTPIHKGSY